MVAALCETTHYDLDLVLIFISNAVNKCCIVVDDCTSSYEIRQGSIFLILRVVNWASKLDGILAQFTLGCPDKSAEW